MTAGLGIDIIEIARIKKSIEDYGDRFLNRIFTPGEIEYCSARANKYQHYAARFAAKEAVYKALFPNISEDSAIIGSDSAPTHFSVDWTHIEVINSNEGVPSVILNGKVADLLPKDHKILISISHSVDFAACVAILESSR